MCRQKRLIYQHQTNTNRIAYLPGLNDIYQKCGTIDGSRSCPPLQILKQGRILIEGMNRNRGPSQSLTGLPARSSPRQRLSAKLPVVTEACEPFQILSVIEATGCSRISLDHNLRT